MCHRSILPSILHQRRRCLHLAVFTPSSSLRRLHGIDAPPSSSQRRAAVFTRPLRITTTPRITRLQPSRRRRGGRRRSPGTAADHRDAAAAAKPRIRANEPRRRRTVQGIVTSEMPLPATSNSSKLLMHRYFLFMDMCCTAPTSLCVSFPSILSCYFLAFSVLAYTELVTSLYKQVRNIRMLEKRFQISTLISSRYFLIWVVLVDKITVNYMGQWSERPLLLACLWKFAESEASRLCTFWEELLMNPEWYPFKIDIAGDICEVCRVLLQTITYVPSILGAIRSD